MTFNPAFFDRSGDQTQREFSFDSTNHMRDFTSQLTRNPFVTDTSLVNKTTLSITTRDNDSMSSIDQIYNKVIGNDQ